MSGSLKVTFWSLRQQNASEAARDGWGAGRSPFPGGAGLILRGAGALGPDMAAVTAQPPPQGGPRRASGQHGGRERALAHAARRSRPCQTAPDRASSLSLPGKTRGLFLIFENYY